MPINSGVTRWELVQWPFVIISAAAPLTGASAATPLGMLFGNGLGLPLTFILITLLMLLFAVGYMAMARQINNAGAFYAFTARGLGGSAGGIVAAIALLVYSCMQIGLLGLLGGAAAGTFGAMGILTCRGGYGASLLSLW